VVAARAGRRFIASDAQWHAIQTTRNRLIQIPGAVTALKQEDRARPPRGEADLEDLITLQTPARSERPSLRIDKSLTEELDYWEVDPAWDGEIFHSAAQAARPLRKGTIPNELILPSSGEKIAIRLVKINGEQLALNV